jgi:hypothetical protein
MEMHGATVKVLNEVVHRPGFIWLRIGRSEGLL